MNFFRAVRSRLHNAHPDHRAIASNMITVALFVLLASVVRAAAELVIAYRYGISAEVDAYLFVFNLLIWPAGVWFSVLTVVLIPLAAEIRQSAAATIPGFRAELFGLTLVVAAGMAAIFWVGLPVLLTSPWAGLPPATAQIASQMVPVLALLAPLRVVTCLFSAWMLSAGRHANTLLESVPSLVLLLALIIFASGGVEPLVWGTLAGFVVHLLLLISLFMKTGEIERPRLARQSPHWPMFWNGFGIMLVGQALMSMTLVVDQFFSAHLGTGAVATLGYASRPLALILAMGGIVVSRATLPVFSQAQATGGLSVRRTAANWAGIMFAVGCVVMVAGWWLAPWAVALLFQRGAFTTADTAAVASVLQYGLPQLPFYFAGLVLVSLLVSQRKYQVIAVVGALNLVVKIIANVAFVPQLGISGLMISTFVMYAFSCLYLAAAVYRKF